MRRNNARGEISPRLSLFSPKQVAATSVPLLLPFRGGVPQDLLFCNLILRLWFLRPFESVFFSPFGDSSEVKQWYEFPTGDKSYDSCYRELKSAGRFYDIYSSCTFINSSSFPRSMQVSEWKRKKQQHSFQSAIHLHPTAFCLPGWSVWNKGEPIFDVIPLDWTKWLNDEH